MRRISILICVLVFLCVPVVLAQTTVPAKASPAIHGQGTPGTIPKFTGNKQIGNSIISESDGNVLVVGGNLQVAVDDAGGFAASGINYASSGGMGLLGMTVGEGGFAVRGQAANPSGYAIGVLGESSTPESIGVLGVNGSIAGGTGVRGQANAATGAGNGVLGEASSPDAIAVFGVNYAANGDPVGVQGRTSSADRGIGVRGQAISETGGGIAVLGEAVSPGGTAGVFNALGGGTILLGSSTLAGEAGYRFRVDGTGRVFANGGFQPFGADFAESMPVAGERSRYEPGDLLVIDRNGSRRMALANTAYSTLVAGIYSTKPGVLASPYSMDDPNLAKEVPMAVVGIVPCKVSAENGAIDVGDLLVTSSTPGHAMKGTDRRKLVGAVVGKALEPLQEGKGVVQVLVTLQ